MESARSTDPLGGPHGRGVGLTFVITSSGMGGAEQQVAQLARTMQRRGWDVGVDLHAAPGVPILRSRGHGHPCHHPGHVQGVPDPRAIARLRAILAKWRPDVTHGHMVHANLLVRLSRPLLRTRVLVSTIHNQDEGSQWRYWAYRLTDRLGDTTTAVSQLAAELEGSAAPRGAGRAAPGRSERRGHGGPRARRRRSNGDPQVARSSRQLSVAGGRSSGGSEGVSGTHRSVPGRPRSAPGCDPAHRRRRTIARSASRRHLRARCDGCRATSWSANRRS